MKKSIKIVGCILAVALFCMIPMSAHAKTRFSLSFNFDARPFLLAPPVPYYPVVERYVVVQPRPCLPPPSFHHQQTIVNHYFYPVPVYAPPHTPYGCVR